MVQYLVVGCQLASIVVPDQPNRLDSTPTPHDLAALRGFTMDPTEAGQG